MVDSENRNPTRNEYTETVSSTKLTVKERFYSYMRSHAPFAQILLNLFTLGAV